MDSSQFINVLPMVNNDITNFRRDFSRAFILSVIYKMKNNQSGFSIDDIKSAIKSDFGDNIPEIIISEALEIFITEKCIIKEGGSFKLIKKCDSDNYNFDKLYSEFESYIKIKINEYDPFINREFKIIFNILLDNFIEILSNSTQASSQVIENIHAAENRELLLNSISEHKQNVDSNKIVDLFIDYLSSQKPLISDLLFKIYQSIIAFDILKNGSIVGESAGKFGEGCQLVIDTNIIVASLCKSNPRNELTITTLQFAKKLGFDIVYSDATKKEFDSLLNMANENLITQVFSFSSKENEIVTDYATRSDNVGWPVVYYELKSFDKIINQLFGAQPIRDENDVIKEGDELNDIKSSFLFIARAYGKTRGDDALTHDARLLYYARKKRKNRTHNIFPEPMIITLDNALVTYDQVTNRNHDEQIGYVMHIRTLLTSLIPFWNQKNILIDKSKIVSGLVKNLTVPINSEITLASYSKILAEKYSLRTSDTDTIKKILILSPLHNEINRALKEEDTEALSIATTQAFSDTKIIEKIIDQNKLERENADLKNRMHTMGETLRIQQEKIKVLNDVQNKPISITNEINIYNTINTSLTLVIKELEKVEPDILKKIDISEEDIKSKDKSVIKRTIEKIEGFLSRSGNTISNSELLLTTLLVLKQSLGL